MTSPLSVKYFGAKGDGVTDDWQAIQNAINFLCVSTGDQEQGILTFPNGTYAIGQPLEFDRRGIRFIGEHKRNTEILAIQSMEAMVRHRRETGLSNSISFRDIRLNGNNPTNDEGGILIDWALRMESINYSDTAQFEIRNVCGTGAYFSYAQDWKQDIDVRACGRRYTVGVTGTIVQDSDQLTLSGVGPWENGDMVIIPSAGPGGADLKAFIDGGAETTTLTLNHTASVGVANQPLDRFLPAVNINSWRWNGQPEGASNISNSMNFGSYCTFERNYTDSVQLYKADALSFIGCKFHARLTTDDPIPKALSLMEWDRTSRLRVIATQNVRPTRRAYVQHDTSSGGQTSAATVSGCEFKDPANYEDINDCAVLECRGGIMHVDACQFEDEQQHQSYENNGIDIWGNGGRLGAGTNTHRGFPGNGWSANVDPMKGITGVNRPGKAHNLSSPWTPAMKFGGNDEGMVYTHQNGHIEKRGEVCHVWARINLSDRGSSTGVVTIEGLPFVASNITTLDVMEYPMPMDDVQYSGGVGSNQPIGWAIRTNKGSATLQLWSTSELANGAEKAQKTEADIKAGVDYFLSFSYLVKD